jgi:hypothetical protein
MVNHGDEKFQPGVKTAVFDMIRNLEIMAVLFSALELDIFQLVGEGDFHLEETAKRKGYDVHALESLVNALTATNFLEKKGNRYILGDIARQLVSDPFLANNVRLSKVYTALFNYPLRVNGNYLHVLKPEDLEVITALGRYSADGLVNTLSRLLPFLRTEPLSLMDLGCGRGFHLVSLARLNPGLRCLGIDAEEQILQQARTYAAQLQLAGITFKKGDMRDIPFEKDLDVITCFTAVRGMGKEDVMHLVRKVFASLKKGGHFVVHDFFLENHGLAPLDNVLFDMKLAMSAKGGKVLRLADFEELKSVGFEDLTRFPVNAPDIPVKGSAFFIYRK